MWTIVFEWLEKEAASIANEVIKNIPSYTSKGEWYIVCDTFGKNYCDRTWSHITGCINSKNDEENIWNCSLSTILHNIFNVYHDINGEGHLDTSFEGFGLSLADYLARYVIGDANW